MPFRPEILAVVASAVVFALVAVLSIRAVKQALRRFSYKPVDTGPQDETVGLYRDRDGIATDLSQHVYSDAVLGLFLASAAAGLVSYISCQSLGHDMSRAYRVSAGLDTGTWILIFFQSISLWARLPDDIISARIFRAFLSTVLHALSIILRGVFTDYPELRHPSQSLHYALTIIQVVAAGLSAVSCAIIYRRPDVYADERLVDRQYTTSLLSQWFFSWASDLLASAQGRLLTLDDLPALDYSLRAQCVNDAYRRCNFGGPLWLRLLKIHWSGFIHQWILTAVSAFLAIFPQYALLKVLNELELRDDSGPGHGMLWVWIAGLGVGLLFGVIVDSWLDWVTQTRLEMPMYSLLASLVFQKATRLYQTANSSEESETEKLDGEEETQTLESAVGKMHDNRQSVVNHMKLDSNRVTAFAKWNKTLPQAIIKLVLGGLLLVRLLGWKAVSIGFIVSLVVLPISTHLSRRYSNALFGIMSFGDRRANILSEVLQGMRQIKLGGLEDIWETKILAARKDELTKLWRLAFNMSSLVIFMNLGPFLLASFALGFHAFEGRLVNSSILFPAIGLLRQIYSTIQLLPMGAAYMIEAWMSCSRLERFFALPEKEEVVQPGERISFKDVRITWPRDPNTTEQAENDRGRLAASDLEFPNGELSVITGRTGSGKGLLLAAILGEVNLVSGTITVPKATLSPYDVDYSHTDLLDENWIVSDSIAFVSQSPWIDEGNVRDNILFGIPYREERYRKVIRACALQPDINFLPDGEETEIGSKGVTLTGDQRWRIALARAIYSRAGILLLDDVLSAVDGHMGRWLAENALSGELANGRTRILVTHHPELVIPVANYSVHLNDGEVESTEQLTPDPKRVDNTVSQSVVSTPGGPDPAVATATATATTRGPFSSSAFGTDSYFPEMHCTDEEKQAIGRVSWHVYQVYFAASGGWKFWAPAMLVVASVPLLHLAQTYVLEQWTSTGDQDQVHHTRHVGMGYGSRTSQTVLYPSQYSLLLPSSEIVYHFSWYIGLYLILTIAQGGTVMVWDALGLRASKELFEKMTFAVLRTPLRWIDSVPAGRVVNRFTGDVAALDRSLIQKIRVMVHDIVLLLVIFGTSLAVSRYIAIVAIVLFWLYTRISTSYIAAARDLKQLDASTLTPVYDQFGAVVSGLVTVRAFGRTGHYINRCFDLVDERMRTLYFSHFSRKWMEVRMGLLGTAYVLIVSASVVFGSAKTASAGFTLTFALQYSETVMSLLQSVAELEAVANAAERIIEYVELPTEDDEGNTQANKNKRKRKQRKAAVPSAAWPTRGKIEIENLTVGYNDTLPPALVDVTFSIQPGQRVGIVGRTGAGKSSLAMSLFRLLEPRSGTIRIDNLDISIIQRSELRRRLAIVPHDPFLFSGTLRSNLDIEGHRDDYELLQALQRVQLIHNTKSDKTMFNSLSLPIAAGGANLSPGQRQLVALARALITRPRVVVLDEATSAVDEDTAAEALRGAVSLFPEEATVLIVAHRVETVVGCDVVVVLEDGRVVEVGEPGEVFRRRGAFWEIVGGEEEGKALGFIDGDSDEDGTMGTCSEGDEEDDI